ncbi:MAG: hypothetical protein DHS20C12_16700 [Pseudohongiella sp.]|nr:MAG: hypothetical protein DHS20C12_16700 [Pseudohongiella sp.]
MQQNEIIEDVRHWLESFIIELNLCPFAKRELAKERIRFCVSSSESVEQLLASLLQELLLLDDEPEIETTLLIHPEVLQDFDDYNQFLDLADELLEMEGYSGVFQIASFHPDYRFAETVDDVENYSNRSPFPLLHLLREASVEREVANYPDIDSIPRQNIRLLRNLGVAKLQALLQPDKSDKTDK